MDGEIADFFFHKISGYIWHLAFIPNQVEHFAVREILWPLGASAL